MAVAGGRPPQQPAADELGDLSWLGSLVSPGGGTTVEAAAATTGRRASPNVLPSCVRSSLPSFLPPGQPACPGQLAEPVS